MISAHTLLKFILSLAMCASLFASTVTNSMVPAEVGGGKGAVLTRQLVCAAQLVPHLLEKCLVAVEVAIPYRRPFLDVVYELFHI